jgi:hypothetical protein
MFKKFHLPDERWRWSKSEGDSGLVPEIDLDTESVYAKISAWADWPLTLCDAHFDFCSMSSDIFLIYWHVTGGELPSVHT